MRKVKSVTLVGLSRKTKDGSEAKKVHSGRKCYIWSGQWNQYWGPDRCGYTPYLPSNPKPDHTVAGVYDFEEAIQATWHCGPEKKIKFVFIDTQEVDNG